MDVVSLPVGSGRCHFPLQGDEELDGFAPLRVGMMLKHTKGCRKGEERRVVGVAQGRLYTVAEGKVEGMPYSGTRELVEEGGVQISDYTGGVGFLRQLEKELVTGGPEFWWLAPTASRPIFITDTEEARNDFWTSWAPGTILKFTSSAHNGLLVKYLGLSNGCALFDTYGWVVADMSAGFRKISLQVPEGGDPPPSAKLYVPLGSPSPSGSMGSNLAAFCSVSGLTPMPSTLPDGIYRSVLMTSLSGAVTPEAPSAAARRLWIATHHLRSW